MTKAHVVETYSFAETQQFAENFAKQLKGGEVICLYGDLGYGKTTFVQGLAKGLGVERNVNSPTFIIMRTYRLGLGRAKGREQRAESSGERVKMFYHVDLYRITHEQEVVDLGLLDIMYDPENIVVIEWSEKMGKLLPQKRVDVHFEYSDEGKRKITIDYI